MALFVRWALGVPGDILKPLGFLVGFPVKNLRATQDTWI